MNRAFELSGPRIVGMPEPSPLWVGAHSLGRDCTYGCLHLLTTHVRIVASSWSCMGSEPTAILKTMLSTGSKVANSSLVGAAPAIKYHRPRWGSGNWRDTKGTEEGGSHYRIHLITSLSGRQDLGVKILAAFFQLKLGSMTVMK